LTQAQAEEIIGLDQPGHAAGLGLVEVVESRIPELFLQLLFRFPVFPFRLPVFREAVAESGNLFGEIGVVKE